LEMTRPTSMQFLMEMQGYIHEIQISRDDTKMGS
jgi:hypothetical protein